MGELHPLAQFGGWAVAILLGLFTWFASARKVQVDESALVLGKWKELVETHESAIRGLREEFASYRESATAEIKDLRDRLIRAERRIRELEDENTGLKRMIAQNSQSTAQIITNPDAAATTAAARKTREARKNGPKPDPEEWR